MIDKLKNRIKAAYEIADEVCEASDEETLRELLRAIRHELDGEAEALEDIRDANLGLRNCAEYWMAEAQRLEELTP